MVRIFIHAILYMLAGLPLAKPSTVVAAKQPNIVIVVADDLGWADVGFHSDRIPTPHLDRIAREGVELDHFYVMRPFAADIISQDECVRHQTQALCILVLDVS